MLVQSHDDGVWISVSRSGDGPPLLLIHGTCADSSSWSSVLRFFEPHFTVYAMDRRGRGDSGDCEAYSYEREFADVVAVVEAIGGLVDVVGHSLGALVALGAAPMLQGRLGRLVLYEPPIPIQGRDLRDDAGREPLVPPGVGQRLQELMAAGRSEEVLELFLREVARFSKSELELTRRARSWASRIAIASTVAREAFPPTPYLLDPVLLARLHVPILLLQGALSPAPFRDTIEALHSVLPSSRVHVLPGQRHTAINAAPELFSRAVLQFLKPPVE